MSTEMVSAPRAVREIDWIDHVWPSKEGNNWPKVQKYCLMSVGGSYTDFHVDFGGSSVWYHVLKGQKMFLFIPPTTANLKAYKEWSSSIDQSEVCQRFSQLHCAISYRHLARDNRRAVVVLRQSRRRGLCYWSKMCREL